MPAFTLFMSSKYSHAPTAETGPAVCAATVRFVLFNAEYKRQKRISFGLSFSLSFFLCFAFTSSSLRTNCLCSKGFVLEPFRLVSLSNGYFITVRFSSFLWPVDKQRIDAAKIDYKARQEVFSIQFLNIKKISDSFERAFH